MVSLLCSLFTVEEKLQSSYPTDTQCGRKHGSTTFAMHFARSFVLNAAGGGYNACLLFEDLEKAYDMVVREMAVECRCTEADLASQHQRLGHDGDDLQWCLDFLCSDGSVMQETGLEIEPVDLAERIYIGSWFCMRETGLPSDQTPETQCGGAQGCSFGGICFSMLYARATREVASCARCENLSFTLPFDPLGASWAWRLHAR